MKNISRSILRLAIPNAVSNITVPLLGLIDTAIAGRVAGDAGIGAIALGGAVFNLLYWNCSFLRMATSGLVGQAYGRGDWGMCRKLLMRGVVLALIISAIFLLFRQNITGIAVWVLSSDNVFTLTSATATYVAIRIWAAPAVLLGYATQGWMVGMQKSKLPMVVAITSNVFNIVFSYILAVRMDMGIEGIALGTVAAQYLALGIWILGIIRDRVLLDTIKEKRYGGSTVDVSYSSFIKKNIDIFLRTIVLVGVHCAMTVFAARTGETELATTACLMHFFMLFSYVSDALAYAAEALTGKYIGAESKDMLRAMIRKLAIWSLILSIAATLGYLSAWSQFLQMLGASSDVVTNAEEYIYWIIFITSLSFMAFVEDGIMLGAANTRAMVMTVWMAGAMGACCSALLWRWDVMWALWIGFGVFMIMRGVLLVPSIRDIIANK
ncbi:MAG: MATE family efflux transporter [Bacteroidales bacterium]|nr:MATE family efflux transporter [Bacteroidales bacterium]